MSEEMMSLKNVEWTGICRACVNPLAGSTHSLRNQKTLHTFNKCTGLEASNDDSLPQGLCNKCNHFIGVWTVYMRDWKQNNTYMWKIVECEQQKAKILEQSQIEQAERMLEVENIKQEQTFFDRIVEVGLVDGEDNIMYEYIDNSSDHQYTMKQETGGAEEESPKIVILNKALITQKPQKYAKRGRPPKSDVRVIYRHQGQELSEAVEMEEQAEQEGEEEQLIQTEEEESNETQDEGEIDMIEDYVHEELEQNEEEQDDEGNMAEEMLSSESYKAFEEDEEMDNTLWDAEEEEDEEITNEPSKFISGCTCSKCGIAFASYLLLENHCNVKHPGVNVMHYICRNCGAAFNSRLKLQNHIKTAHTMPAAKILATSASSTTVTDNSSTFKCSKCQVTVPTVVELLAHMKTCAPFNMKCDECPKEFKNKVALAQHKKLAHLGKQHICNVCGHSYKSAASLSFHRRVHKAQAAGEFKCPLCHKLLDRKEALEKHMNVAHKKKKFACKVCGMECSTQIVHRMHMATHILGDEHKCDICNRVFKMYSSLELHKPRCKGPNHTPQKRFYIPKPPSEALDCPLCNEQLPGITEFKAHLFQVHGNEDDINVNDVIHSMKRHQCSTCGNKYLTPRALMQHTQIHGKKRHICNVCSKAFLTPVQLKSHVITHFSVEAIAENP